MYDADIRQSLRAEVERRHCNDANTKIVEELGLRQGEVRVDVAVVNGVLKGYEIKSPADTLRRLPTQVEVYSQVLDFATIVLAEVHRKDAYEIIPAWWEVIVATGAADGTTVSLELVRDGYANPCVDKRALAELLWHAETMDMLRSKGAHRGLSRAPRSFAWDRLVECCSLDEIRDAVRSRIKGRLPRRAAR